MGETFTTALSPGADESFHKQDYPLIFVTAPIKEVENKYGGLSGKYEIGTDVLSANNPNGGNKLWIMLPDGQTKLLFPLDIHQTSKLIDTPVGLLGSGSVVEPNLSEDGRTVYFSYFHNADDKTSQSALPKLGADLYSINISPLIEDYYYSPELLKANRLTTANIAANGVLTQNELYKDALNPLLKSNGSNNWGSVYMHPEEMRTKHGLKLAYVSDKKRISNSNEGMRNHANHNFNLYIADIKDDGSLSNHRQFQYYTTTSALSPNRLRNGIAFSYQSTTEDARHWEIQGLTSSGQWYPIWGYGNNPEAAHLSTFCVKEKGEHPGDYLVTTSYYNLNNNGFGALFSLKLSMAGMNAYDYPDAGVLVPRQLGSKQLSLGVDIDDEPSKSANGKLLGKFTTPRCGMPDELYFSHTETSANQRVVDSDNNRSIYRSYIGFRNNLEPFHPTIQSDAATGTGIAKVIEDESGQHNLVWPLPVLTWEQRSGDVEQAYTAPAVASGTTIEPGNPFAEVGTSALWNTDRKPFDCWLGNNGQVPYSPNQAMANINAETQELVNQTAGLNRIQNQQNFCEYLLPENVFGIAINVTSNKLRAANLDYESTGKRSKETSKLLGVHSVTGQSDQSFKAIVPANIPFDFHLLDRKTGLKLTDVRSWHSLKPEESRTDCGGCHQHEKGKAIPFEGTSASVLEAIDMITETKYIDYTSKCEPEVKVSEQVTMETLEWKADIWPKFDQNCSTCHNSNSSQSNNALQALSYANEEQAYNMLLERNFINHTLGAIGSPAWWAARGERTDGRNNDLEKYQPNYNNHKWGFKHSTIHKVEKPLCDGNSPEEAKWVYKFGKWIDNHGHRDVSKGIFNTKLDRYHPTINSAISGGSCTGSNLNVGWWDDSGKIKRMLLKVNDRQVIELFDQDNGSVQVSLGETQLTDSIDVFVQDQAGNTQSYQKSLDELQFECQTRLEGSQTSVTAIPYTHEQDYTDQETDIGTILNENAVREDSLNDPINDPDFNIETDTASILAADSDEPIKTEGSYTTIELAIVADATISQYNENETLMNFGGSPKLKTYTGESRQFLLQADFDVVPKDRKLLKASLKLHALEVNYPSSPKLLAFKVTKPWVEGSKIWSFEPDGTTWVESNYIDHNDSEANNWLTPGGDINISADFGYGENGLVKRATVNKDEWVSMDITDVVQHWLDRPDSNFGLMLRGINRDGNGLVFASKEHEDELLRPYIEYSYAGDAEDKEEDGEPEQSNTSIVRLPIVKDTTISKYNDSEKRMNFGSAKTVRTWSADQRRILMQADLADIPQDKEIFTAFLNLYISKINYPSEPELTAFRMTSNWKEGTQTWSSTSDGATWFESNYADHEASSVNDWKEMGGDFDQTTNYGFGENGTVIASNLEAGKWVKMDITQIVKAWKNGSVANHGLLLQGKSGGNGIYIASREDDDTNLHPFIEYRYIEQPSIKTLKLETISDTTLSQYNEQEKRMNFGGTETVRTWQDYSRKILIKQDLSGINSTVVPVKAELNIFVTKISYPSAPKLVAHKIQQAWKEGTQKWSSLPDGATWFETDYVDHNKTSKGDWTEQGASYDQNNFVGNAEAVAGEWIKMDITEVFEQWLIDPLSNHGLVLRGSGSVGNDIHLASKENADQSKHPFIELSYIE